jgi:aspartate kinase
VASNLQKRGHKSVYLTGEQARIITDENYSDARIIRVEAEKIKSLLKDNNIVVVGGGQGVSENGDITTLGRGGSDTTGCALGVALGAEEIHIYTDVEGIMTADPRKVKEAVLLEKISYENCCNMAYKGAKVIHPRAVEIAMQSPDSKLYVKSTFSSHPGTLICNDDGNIDEAELTGVAGLDNLVYGRILSNEYKDFGKLKEIMDGSALQDSKVYYGTEGIVFISDSRIFTAAEKLLSDIGFELVKCENVSEVSIIGSNFEEYPELCQEIKDKIQKSGIDIKMCIAEDKIISFVINEENYVQTMNLLHEFVINRTACIIN